MNELVKYLLDWKAKHPERSYSLYHDVGECNATIILRQGDLKIARILSSLLWIKSDLSPEHYVKSVVTDMMNKLEEGVKFNALTHKPD